MMSICKSYPASHEISQQHDVSYVNTHAMVHHGVHNLIDNGCSGE